MKVTNEKIEAVRQDLRSTIVQSIMCLCFFGLGMLLMSFLTEI
jgi:hypothetical protein